MTKSINISTITTAIIGNDNKNIITFILFAYPSKEVFKFIYYPTFLAFINF